jgi:hypothetical protein
LYVIITQIWYNMGGRANSMSIVSLPQPDLAAHREATTAPFPKVVQELVAAIGRKLTAFIAGVKDVRALDRWIEGAAPYKNAEERLRFAFQVVKTLDNHEHSSVVQAWLTGLNPELNDRVPIRVMREGDLETVGPEILGAVRAFVAGG